MKQAISYKAAWNHYDKVRAISLQKTYKNLPNYITNKVGIAVFKDQISLKSLDFQTFLKLRHWENSGQRVVKWDWEAVQKKYKTHPKRFELAIWHKQRLSGASIGRPTWSGNKLRIDFIEANPDGSPLSGMITDIVILAGRIYAEAIGASQLRIIHPVNDKVKKHYLSKTGFLYNQRENFCYWNL